MELLFWLSAFGVAYAYFGYPLLLLAVLRLRGPRPKAVTAGFETPRVSVVITCRNEARVIREKLENTLLLTYQGRLARDAGVQILVASDASDDGTDDVVREFAARGVELVRLEERGGKERAQQAAVEQVRGDVVVFTDAKIRLEPEALDRFVAYFADPSVGAVSSIDRVEGEGSGEGMYVRYEMWLRALESEFGSLVGVSGSCFAVRRAICADLRADIPSDFALLLAARRRGLRGVHAPDVVASYRPVATERAEFERKVRTVLRGITTLMTCSEVLNPFVYGVFSWQVASHKLMRWLVPWFVAIGTFSTLAVAASGFFYSLVALCVLLFYIGAALAAADPKMREHVWCRLPLFFLVVNGGIAVAWYHYIRGKRTMAWNPSAKGQ